MTAIKYLFQTLIVLAFVGMVYFMFEWQTASGIIALIFLVTIQILYIAARTRKISQNSPLRARMPSPPRAVKEKTATVKPTVSSGETINAEIFSKFQQNLSASSASKEEEPQDVVSISSKIKKSPLKTAPSIAASPEESGSRVAELLKKTIKEAEKKRISQESSIAEKLDNMPIEPLGSIFDDLDDQESSNTTAINPKGGKKKVKSVEAPAPLQSNENLNLDLFSNKEDESADAVDDEEVVLSLVSDFMKDKNYKDALGTILPYYESCEQDDAREIKDKEVIRLKGECEFELGEHLTASKSWQELFNNYMKPKDKDFLPLLEGIMERFSREKKQQYAVQFYFTALNEYRQLRNTKRMDDIYGEIEVAYNSMEDWPRLIQTYQNHLTIKKIIKDYKGQIVLLDHLGKLQYDQGDAAGSKASYQQSIAIKKQLAKRRG